MISITFFGTHEFAAYILRALIESKQCNIQAVVTQPAKPVGRKKTITPSAVATYAHSLGLPILQPESLKKEKNLFEPPQSDLYIVCQYGLIIPQHIIATPRYGVLNIHPSLLPHYRGASPIQSALIQGETETGITIMLMDEKMDHGPILTQEKIIINSDDTYVTLSSRLMPLSAKLLLKTIPDWIDKKITPQEQDHDQATFCKLFTRDDGKIDWNQTAEKIYNLYRGLSPWPGIWTTWQGKRLKLTAIKPASLQLPPGQVSIHENRLYVGTADGAVEVLNVQLEGKKEMDTPLFINGYTQIEKDTLGTPYV